jgi:hypothetical protein
VYVAAVRTKRARYASGLSMIAVFLSDSESTSMMERGADVWKV